MKKKTLALLTLCSFVALGSLQVAKPVTSEAASAWSGTHYGMDFDYHESNRFEMSSWSNGDMFDCTWSPNNVKFNNDKMG